MFSMKKPLRGLVRLALCGSLAMSLSRPGSAGSPDVGPQVAPADAFVDAIGADSHFNYRDTPYYTAWPTVSETLIASGIRHLRDGGARSPLYLAHLTTLGEHGITHGAGFLITSTPDVVRASIAAFAPYLDNVEAPNEYDGYRDKSPDWAARLAAFQKMLYTTVHSDPANAKIKVLGPPLARLDGYAEVGPLDQYEDAANLHATTCDQNPGTDGGHIKLAYLHGLIRQSTLTKPIWTTETGYNDDMKRPCALADDTIAKYDPRTVAEKWNTGEQRVYFYQLTDTPVEKIFGGMGLMRADGTAKPQLTALGSMIHLLADPGPPFTATPLRYELGGDTRNVHQTLLQKRDGRYELLLWLEVRSWDPRSRTPIAVDPQSVSLSLPASISSARVYSYTADWTLAATPLRIGGGTVRLRVTDAISFVELTP